MSEPVGNAPRGTEIPNNSHKAREAQVAAATPAEPREALSKIVKGGVKTRKAPFYKRIARSLIADDATSVGDYIITDVIGPAIKNLIYDIITGGASRTLYGSSRGARRESSIRGGGPISSIRTRYDRMAEEPTRRGLTQEQRAEQRARHDFREVQLDFREEAIEVLEALIDYANRYGTVSVAELYTLTGVTGSYVDQKWGWTEAEVGTADIRQHRGGWLIDLPSPNVLR